MTYNIIGKLTTWWNARRDRASDLPRVDAPGLSDFERRVIGAGNSMIRTAEIRFMRAAYPRYESLETHQRELNLFDEPGRVHAVAAAFGRTDTDRVLPPGTHVKVLTLITIAELVFNVQAFAIFGESTIMTAIMALAVGLGLPAVAYVLGAEIRQQQWSRGRLWLWIGVAVSVMTTLAGINYVRSVSLAASIESTEIDLGLDLAYLIINLLIFIAATVTSYYAHDSVAGFVETAEAIDYRYAAMASCRGAINTAVEEFRARQEQIRQCALCLIGYYRAINRRTRQDLPSYFDDDSHPDCVPLARLLNLEPERRD